MRHSIRHAAPSHKGGRGQQIRAKGPQDCQPIDPIDFISATLYVARAFMAAPVVPKEFFAGAPIISELMSGDGAQRTLLAAYAHFKQNGNSALSFFFRYKALLLLRATTDLSPWITTDDGDEYAQFSPDLLATAARSPLLASGHFDPACFMVALQARAAAAPRAANSEFGEHDAENQEQGERVAA